MSYAYPAFDVHIMKDSMETVSLIHGTSDA